MAERITGTIRRGEPLTFWRVVYDNECSDPWNNISRTRDPEFIAEHGLGQAPAVYGYSPVMDSEPNGYYMLETGMDSAYYNLNDFDTQGARDGLGRDRCEGFLFKDDTALYNGFAEGDRGFPKREMLTMSGNLLQEIAWETNRGGGRYLKFKTLKLGNSVAGMTHKTHPALVHQFNIVQFRDGQTLTIPKVNRNGYLYYYLVSKDGYGYMPERWVKMV